ncbi:D-glucuronyl C5-epimerase family protein [Clostridium sp. BJN0013]|uniref:D-glucuronyl C5-epimerase family protein n=1 Tax=Clostridium sp. BJN0013 TaxID=3236840 RepID=UPI0034C61473
MSNIKVKDYRKRKKNLKINKKKMARSICIIVLLICGLHTLWINILDKRYNKVVCNAGTKPEKKSKEGNVDIIKSNLQSTLKYAKYEHSIGEYEQASKGYQAIISNSLSNKPLELTAQAYLELSNHKHTLEKMQTKQYLEYSKSKRDEYKKAGCVLLNNVNYTTTSDYFNASEETCYYENDYVHLDENGLPMVKYDSESGGDGYFYYNPVTIAQFSLTQFGKYKKGTGTKNKFIDSVDKLLSLQSSSGVLKLNFRFKHYINEYAYEPGWVSSLAQGQAISVFVRAYQVTSDKKYLDAANRAYEFMCIPVDEGGTKDTTRELDGSSNVFFQEYITNPKSYTLNGFIYTILGIYDLSQTKDSVYSKNAHEMFINCNNTLLKIIYKYDLGYMTAYDAAYLTKKDQYPNINIEYHKTHIELVDAMYSITKNPVYKYYNLLWKSYVLS